MNKRHDEKAWVFRAFINRLGFASFLAARFQILAVLGLLAFAASTTLTYAQSNADGYIFGSVGTAKGGTVTAVNNDTGMKRDVTPESSGDFRLSSLPPGTYTVTLKTAGQADQVNPSVSVTVGSGTAVYFGGDQAVNLGKFVVNGSMVSPIDTSTVESVTIFRSEQITALPVERNTSAIALLAPGTTQGVAAFGNLVSFGGASVAENAYYVNGFNLTNARNGLGGGSVPFEMYDQFQVKTGGYSAEFGRSTGGVINATTKSGSNTFHAGANVYYEPSNMAWRSPSVYLANGQKYIDHSMDLNGSQSSNLWASGPIWKNHIFFYGLYNIRRNTDQYANIGTFVTDKSNDPFWGGKLNWNITDTQSLEWTAISDKRTNENDLFGYDNTTHAVGGLTGTTMNKRGGRDNIYRYTGSFTQNFTVTAMYGTMYANYTDAGTGDNSPFIYDGRSGSLVQLGSASQLQPSLLSDYRKATRVDADYNFSFMGSHHLRFGYDKEDNGSTSFLKYSGPGEGGQYWRYYVTAPGRTLANGGIVPAGVTQVARLRYYSNGGSFSTLSTAYYAQDEWKLMNDRLLLSLGLRDDNFNNKNSLGATFLEMKKQIAPRLGAAYDVSGDGTFKLFANWGRYFLPVATNTNIRLAGGETYWEKFYVLNSVDPSTGLPTIGSQIGNQTNYSLGTIKDPTTIVDKNITPQHQDEIILGFQKALNKDWNVGVRGQYRKMKVFYEDMTVDPWLNQYAAAHGIAGFNAGGNDYYVLTNPGSHSNIVMNVDFGDGKGLTQVTIPYAALGYPPASRTYYGAEFFFEKTPSEKWTMQGSYTWSHTYGNDEGTVMSDIGQADNGLTELFDHPGLMDGRYGDLNNDRRHKFKLFGAYNLTSEWQMGANFRLDSGTPLLAMGYHPTDPASAAYGAVSMYVNGKLVPRGSLGRTPWTNSLDWTVKYTPKWANKKLVLGLDIFNVLNRHTPSEYVATAEQGGIGTPYPAYGLPAVYQQPRYIRFSASYKY